MLWKPVLILLVKYKQAFAIIIIAPPVRLTYPRFTRLENPPPSSVSG